MADPKKQKIPFLQLLKIGWAPYVRLAKYIRPYRRRFLVGVLAGVAFGAMSGAFPLIVNYVGTHLFPGGAQMSQKDMIKAGMTGGGPLVTEIGTMLWIVALIPLVMIARSLLGYLSSYCTAWVSFRILRDMRQSLFQHMLAQSVDFFNKEKSGKLISRVINDTRVAQSALVSISADIFKDPVQIVGVVIGLFALDWKFCLIAVAIFPIAIVPVIIFSRKVRKAGKEEESQAAAMTVVLQESFAGVRVIKSFAREDYQSTLFNKISDAQCRNSMRVKKASDVVQPLIEAVSACGAALAIVYVYLSGLSIFTLLSLMGGMFFMYDPAKRMSRLPMLFQKCITSATNVFNLLALNASVQDKPNAIILEKCRGEVQFDNVSFSYNEGKSAVEDISFHIEAGKQYALVGASGAGKSTIMSLLLRLYDPQSGVIRVDGHDVRDLQQISLRDNIGIVTQESFLFHDTIYENIRYGRLDATEAEILAASKLAFAHDFIMAKPEGYQTIVGDKGSLLSGGQQQRISIARALLKNAPILLLDEAMSALDSESEKVIQVALERLTQGRTVIAIAHRLSTVLKSDTIVVMDHGRIVEMGTHRELLDKSPLYRNLYELQFLSHQEMESPENTATLIS